MKNKVFRNETQLYFDKSSGKIDSEKLSKGQIRRQNTHVFTINVTHKYDFGEASIDGQQI